MRLSSRLPALFAPALAAACALFPLRAMTQTTPTFAEHTLHNGGDLMIRAHGDFNNDGREDLIVTDSGGGSIYYTYLYLSNGNGTYDAPIQLATPANAPYAVGDFNHDGNLDYAVGDATGQGVHVWQGHGDGTFTKVADLTSDLGIGALIPIDVNHDNCTDLVVLSSMNSSSTIKVWKSSCGSTISFTSGQYLTASSGLIQSGIAASGDFDADGSPDLVLVNASSTSSSTQFQIWYGDGTGNFGSPIQATDPRSTSDQLGSVADIDGNGTSDLVMSAAHVDASGHVYDSPYIAVFKGNKNRTLTYETINTPDGDCPAGGIQVADFNGDGWNDFAYPTSPCSQTAGNGNDVHVLAATGKGVFGKESSVYSSPYGTMNLFAVKTTQGTRPDIMGSQFTYPSSGSYPSVSLYLLQNTTSGGFPACGTTNEAEGVHVCSPTTSSASSPVKFSISAAGATAMRTVAVWVDGKKANEQFAHAFSNYSFFNQSLTLSAGTHTIGIFGTGWDGSFQKKSFSLTVSGGCAAPSGYGVHVCSPVNGSTVSSPVQVTATAHIPGTLARMEVWVNGMKKYTETTSTHLSTTVSLSAGTYQFTVNAVNKAGAKYKSTVKATVK